MATALRAAEAPPAAAPDTDTRLLVVEYLDAPPQLLEPGAAEVPCARGWCGGGWTVAFPVDVLVRDLGVSKAALVRNGLFLVRGQQLNGWFVVERVLRRAAITGPDGAVLVRSWPTGASAPTRRWVRDLPDEDAGVVPGPLNLPPEEKVAHLLAQGRARSSRYRARRNAIRDVTGGPPETESDHVTPPAPPVSLSISKEIEKIGRILAPFASRGYQHNPEFWADMAATYPDARLVAEAYNVASWLKKPLKKNRETPCSEGFLINWLKKAQRDASAPPPAHGMAYQTPSPGKLLDPAPVLPDGAVLQMIDPAEARRALLQAKRLTLPEKLALVKNGRHQ